MATIKLTDGSVYEGDVVNGKPQGKGKFKYADGDVYEGDIANDKYNGNGVYTGKSFAYEGGFADGKFHGHGARISYDGMSTTYMEGTWKNGSPIETKVTQIFEKEYSSIKDEEGVHHAMFNLGIYYLKGEGVEKDKKKAVQWLKKAAANGNKEAKEILKGIKIDPLGVIEIGLNVIDFISNIK
jgi:hypothetical protein